MSMPRAATSVAHRKRRLWAFIRPITRSRSLCARLLDSGSASSPCFCRTRDIVVSSRVLQKMIAALRVLGEQDLQQVPAARDAAHDVVAWWSLATEMPSRQHESLGHPHVARA